ncbi:MAG: selenocysteine lyase [Eubacterium sp.]|jgi:selenocysteine lyase/cysteine desulfurase|nr:selenocysteine lyase [Eubacterium sp.]
MTEYKRYKNPDGYRSLVVGVNTMVPLDNGTYTTAVNFDNAATTPAFVSVGKEIHDFLPWYSSIHRGKGYKSIISTEAYEAGREIVRSFVKANKGDTIIYTKNTTESINLLACTMKQQKGNKDVVISTWMEHAANDLPWRNKFKVEYVEIDRMGRLDLNDFEAKLKKHRGNIRLVTVTGAANVTGYLNDIYTLAALVHKYGTRIHVDGAQLVPHIPVDMKPEGSMEHIDFLSFSAHKLYAPFGSGVLIGPKTVFEEGVPYTEGGSAIKLVTHDRIWWEEPPAKCEAGSPNLMGIVAMVAALKTLSRIGMQNAFEHEVSLLNYAYGKMCNIPDIHLYSHPDRQKSIGVIPFTIDGVHHSLISAILSYEAGIAVRNGFFCAHPYCARLLGYSGKDIEDLAVRDALFPGLVRISFGLYNTLSEIDRFIYWIKNIVENKKFFVDKYGNSRSLYNIKNEV